MVLGNLLDLYDGAFSENSERLKPAKYFHKMLHVRCLTGLGIRLWM